VLPSEHDVERVVKEATTSLGVDSFDVPFTIESARHALMKVVTKEPPCTASQEFKDAVIWHNCLRLASEDEVALVTSDKAFFKGRDYSQGLANNLLQEADQTVHNVTVFSDLGKFLEHIRLDKNVLSTSMTEALCKVAWRNAEEFVSRNGFAFDSSKCSSTKSFATENPDDLWIEFNLQFECLDVCGLSHSSARLMIEGDVMFSTSTNEFRDLRTPEIDLSYRLPDGTFESKGSRTLYAATIVLGHKDVSHSVRHPI
jgi:hypothetical protein